MHTKAKYMSIVSLADVIALLLPKLEVEYDAELNAEDIQLVYNQNTETFTINLDLEWDTDFSENDESSESDDEDGKFEIRIQPGNRVWACDLSAATGADRSKWPFLRKQVTLVYRNGSSVIATVERIDHDGELFVWLDGDSDYRSVSNFDKEDVDEDEYLAEVEFVRWSSI